MKYTSKYASIEAIQWKDSSDTPALDALASFWASIGPSGIYITTHEGSIRVMSGDYVIKVGHGQYQVLKPDAFTMLFQDECDNCHYCGCSE